MRDPGGDGLFAWASVGIDPTSESRLRISGDQARKLFGEHPVRLLPAGTAQPFGELLSQRDYDKTAIFGLDGLLDGETPLGFLLLLESPLLELDEMFFRLVFSALEETVFDMLIERRSRIFSNLRDPGIFDRNERERLLREESPAYSVRLSLREAIDRIHESLPHADRYRILADLRRVVSSMLAGAATVLMIDDHEMEALFAREQDELTLSHQLSTSISEIIPQLPGDIALVTKAGPPAETA